MQKKIWKKSICAVLSTLLVLSSATSFTAFAADKETDAAPSAEEFFSSEQEFNFDESDPHQRMTLSGILAQMSISGGMVMKL